MKNTVLLQYEENRGSSPAYIMEGVVTVTCTDVNPRHLLKDCYGRFIQSYCDNEFAMFCTVESCLNVVSDFQHYIGNYIVLKIIKCRFLLSGFIGYFSFLQYTLTLWKLQSGKSLPASLWAVDDYERFNFQETTWLRLQRLVTFCFWTLLLLFVIIILLLIIIIINLFKIEVWMNIVDSANVNSTLNGSRVILSYYFTMRTSFLNSYPRYVTVIFRRPFPQFCLFDYFSNCYHLMWWINYMTAEQRLHWPAVKRESSRETENGTHRVQLMGSNVWPRQTVGTETLESSSVTIALCTQRNYSTTAPVDDWKKDKHATTSTQQRPSSRIVVKPSFKRLMDVWTFRPKSSHKCLAN